MSETKAENLRDSTSYLNKALPDEPVFILLARDPIAAQIARLWATAAHEIHDKEKIENALSLASSMDAWYEDHEFSPCLENEPPTERRRGRQLNPLIRD